MGTNYYAVPNRPSVQSPIHIGKASCGWLFLFAEQNDEWHEPPVVWNTYEQVMDWLKTYAVDSKDFVIMDEYDRIVSFEEFKETVEYHQKHDGDNPKNFQYSKNVNGYRFTEGEFW